MATRIGNRRRSVLVAAALAGALGMIARGAPAQQPPNATDRAVAQSLFDDGRRLMQDGKFDEACPKLAESQRLDPGGGTLMNLALCHEKQGKLASAWSEFNEALSQAVRDGRAEREASAREHIAALAPKLSRLAIDVPLSARVDGLVIKLDGVEVGPPVWGSAAPVDPGAHVVQASAPLKRTWSTKIDAAVPGAVARVSVPALEDDPEARAAAAGPRSPATAGAGAGEGAAPESPPRDESRRTIGFVVGGAGVVALAAGAVFGVRALSKRSESNGECPNDRCTQKGVDLNDQAMTSAWIANVGVGLGLVGLGVGGYLLLTSGEPAKAPAPAALRVVPQVGARAGGISLQGSFE